MQKYILSIDQGTTSTRSMVFDNEFKIIGSSQKEFKQFFPKDGCVEHDPLEIMDTVYTTVKETIENASIGIDEILSIGIVNQRETVVLWNKITGKPIYNAIVWQDRRTAGYCNKLKEQGHADDILNITGLIVDSYFSATKIKWLLDNISEARELANKGELLFGTIDTWIIWNLTNGKNHVTDATNASRTMIYDIKKNVWSTKLLKLFDIPEDILPEVKDCADDFGLASLFDKEIKIGGVAGDQQAAAIGQACLSPGSVKSTYGTGCFMIMNTGEDLKVSTNKLLSTIAYRIDGKTSYALEGSIFIAGAAVQWLRDSLKIISDAQETNDLYNQADTSQKIYLVPAFSGLGAPYWDGEARGSMFGLTRNTGIPEMVKAAIDSVAYQTKDLLLAMEKDSGMKINVIRVDGGMVNNESFVQFLSSLLLTNVDRPTIIETTSLGAAYLAGYQSKLFRSLSDIDSKWKSERVFEPKIHKKEVKYLYNGWLKAVKGTLAVK
ncbi:glycerol kinase GlpK [Alphaproteobacteria bacterium]|jgi:glycerol kinase|nr:glycerol kinase GlpK [Alphaproteobacteria bacterium]MDB3974520.1 glycerol kinase GlpK [Alphaproteobacteria bacterium]MDC0967928.1 glycerol kinase GlpK [Alphaproteobacteria bacterium]